MSFRAIFTPPTGVAPKKAAPTQSVPRKPQTNRRTNFQAIYPDDAEITMMIGHNPKLPGSEAHKRFEAYWDSKTVGAVLEKGGTYKDIANDLGRRFILVTDK